MLKECRLVIHSGTIEKCERLGIQEYVDPRIDDSPFCIITITPFIKIVSVDDVLKYIRVGTTHYTTSDLPEVSDKEFMSWPEPIKVGDFVRYRAISFQVESVKGDFLHNSLLFTGIRFDVCEKLSKDKVDLLGLNPKDGDI